MSKFVLILFILSVFCAQYAYSSSDPEVKLNEGKVVEWSNKQSEKPACSAPEVEIGQRKLCGKHVKTSSGKGAHAYLGIPYAESTAGENRWRPPVPNKGWKGLFKATGFGLACPQKNRFDHDLPYSEDCLSINVWKPDAKSDKPRAVIVFIYGGDFLYGFSGDPGYDGAYISANGNFIVVTLNYRLGVLGFMGGIKDKKSGEVIKGNFGLLDQIESLKWVRKNIKAFGGDPDKITIQGQSAGAMSVGIHLTVSPASSNLFRAAIMESNPLAIPIKTLEQGVKYAKKLADDLGCSEDEISCLRNKSTKETLASQDSFNLLISTMFHGIRGSQIWAPMIDGVVITEQPIVAIKEGNLKKPIIIGTNKNDALVFIIAIKWRLNKKKVSDFDYHVLVDLLFPDKDLREKIYEEYPPKEDDNTIVASKLLTDWLFTCPSLFLASNSSPKTWMYLFDHVPSFNFWGRLGPDFSLCSKYVCHAAEIVYVFHTAENTGYSFTEEEKLLSRLMVQYWANFAKTLNPNGNGPKWPEFKSDDSHVILVTPIDKIIDQSSLKAHCSFWDKLGYNLHYSLWDIF